MSIPTTTSSKRTALYNIHEKSGAKIIPFAGFEMPVRYSGDLQEHLCVRNRVGMFDVSHMGEFLVQGPQALELIQRITTNDASKLVDGKAQYSCFPNKAGGIVDDCIVYRKAENDYLIVVNAGNIDKDWAWVNANNTNGAKLTDISPETSLLAVSGPFAQKTLQKLTNIDLGSIEYYAFRTGSFNGVEEVIVATTGYTGEACFEIMFHNSHAEKMWNAIMEAGKEFGIEPIGLGARDTLRLEMGYMLYGNDIDDSTSPLEAGLGWITKLNKGEFNSSEIFRKQKAEGVTRKLMGFEILDRGIPRHGYEIHVNGKKVGHVTSGSQSPSLQKGIALGYIASEFAVENGEADIIIREKPVRARIVKPPFLKK